MRLDEIFDKIDYRKNRLPKGEYESCTFSNCDFSGSDLTDVQFLECEFVNCDLSLAKLTRTALRDVRFKDCKMLGLQFGTCNEFGLSFAFKGCKLQNASFYKTKIKKTVFESCDLDEADFSASDLSGSVFHECNLRSAMFEETNLEKADLRTACNYIINPEKNRIKKASFSLIGLPGLLFKYNIVIEQ
jgi:uncharacterized protein YjbI with pentapeptide repeats